ncbi:unnamed protein product [Microthlaspi erraticum]|uniref:Uncharacterized protein n=1 Tax=Microthlaspi erraticum TaxID=1685480 RepID=A0A6D2KA66_9BRAS|nr:unnamed protein product [Microthlaspi erraticum]CAA7048701.1 unnamed protein product [Microthlaspi erraticum]
MAKASTTMSFVTLLVLISFSMLSCASRVPLTLPDHTSDTVNKDEKQLGHLTERFDQTEKTSRQRRRQMEKAARQRLGRYYNTIEHRIHHFESEPFPYPSMIRDVEFSFLRMRRSQNLS